MQLCTAIIHENRAIEFAKELVHRFNTSPQAASPDATAATHHHLTLEWYGDGSPVRSDMERFIENVPLADLHGLKELITELLLVPIQERPQEVAHSLVSINICHRRTPLFSNMSLMIRL